jgi:lipopolysaccharide/colanic/teichoic acid biosynthesis glycosyltransferase
MTGYRGKRALDLVITVPALIVLSPVMAVVAALVAWRMGHPVLFRQVRPGLGERPFAVAKFRTMKEAYDAAGRQLPDRERLTALGRFLRVSSLDELPGLFNVIKGEMSLVGPRPLVTKYLPYYTEGERTRCAVRPGITGWAQVNGRNDLPWDQRLACDAWYVAHCSLALDLRILGMTVWKVLRRANIQVDTAINEPDLSVERHDRRVSAA